MESIMEKIFLKNNKTYEKLYRNDLPVLTQDILLCVSPVGTSCILRLVFATVYRFYTHCSCRIVLSILYKLQYCQTIRMI